jgi:hypothetical protein
VRTRGRLVSLFRAFVQTSSRSWVSASRPMSSTGAYLMMREMSAGMGAMWPVPEVATASAPSSWSLPLASAISCWSLNFSAGSTASASAACREFSFFCQSSFAKLMRAHHVRGFSLWPPRSICAGGTGPGPPPSPLPPREGRAFPAREPTRQTLAIFVPLETALAVRARALGHSVSTVPAKARSPK